MDQPVLSVILEIRKRQPRMDTNFHQASFSPLSPGWIRFQFKGWKRRCCAILANRTTFSGRPIESRSEILFVKIRVHSWRTSSSEKENHQ
jgi:hypothetical protein